MKHPQVIAGMLMAAGVMAQSRDSRQADVTIYVSGSNPAPGPVDYGARATVTWMFARHGVRLEWRDGEPRRGAPSGSAVVIQVRFAKENQAKASPGALAEAFPFGNGGTAVNVLYDRISVVSGRSSRVQALLAHVLAHEIGHVLQCSNQHAGAGIMKAHWNGQDYDAMNRKPLGFTPYDVDLIKQGLNARKARPAESSPEALR